MQALAPGFADQRWRIVDRGDVRALVQGEDHRRSGADASQSGPAGPGVGRVAYRLQQADNEGGGQRLEVGRGGDVNGPRRTHEGFGVEVRFGRRLPCAPAL